MKVNLQCSDNKKIKRNFKERFLRFLEEYLKKREEAVFYESLVDIGRVGKKSIKKMIKAKLFKPSELKKEVEIVRAEKFHQRLIEFLEDNEISIMLDDGINIEKIRTLKITNLTECKIVYEAYKYIGTLGRRRLGFFIFIFMPFSAVNVTIIEFLLLCIAVVMWMILKRYVI